MAPTLVRDAAADAGDEYKLNVALVDQLAQEQGISTVKGQAAYFGVSRGYMFRLRSHEQLPSLPLGLRMARKLRVSPYELFGCKQVQA